MKIIIIIIMKKRKKLMLELKWATAQLYCDKGVVLQERWQFGLGEGHNTVVVL